MAEWSIWTPAYITSPVFMIVMLGIWLRRTGRIDEAFIATSSALVFNLTLPLLMFIAVANSSLAIADHGALIVFCMVMACLTPLLSHGWAVLGLQADEDRGAFVQAAFRSNLGIVGIALCIAAFGDEGAALGALVLAVVTPIYNVVSVLVLSGGQTFGLRQQIMTILKNPLIIAIALAMPFQWAEIKLGGPLLTAGEWLARMTLPLALLGIGGSIGVQLRGGFNMTILHAALLKLVLLPAVVLLCALWLGFRASELGVVVLMFASPTAAAAFVMAKAMRADDQMTARVIALSTLGSLLTLSGFLYVLFYFALV